MIPVCKNKCTCYWMVFKDIVLLLQKYMYKFELYVNCVDNHATREKKTFDLKTTFVNEFI